MPCDQHSLIADVAFLAAGKVLLVRYKDINKYDHQKGWFLPDDGLLHLEHPDQGAQRILKEQLAFDAAQPSLAYIESFKGNNESWHLVFHYKLELPEPPKLSPSGDIEKAEWFGLKNLPPPPEVAHHGWALGILRRINAPV
jgi:ADP-ribose pyrophosphatase YjhB (NUDIX family)